MLSIRYKVENHEDRRQQAELGKRLTELGNKQK